jgi:hypothetical protein
MIQNSAMLVDLNISLWTGRKMDKQVAEEIDDAKGTTVRGGNYHKRLMGGAKALEHVATLGGALRTWHYSRTLAWSDRGTRLLPVVLFPDYKAELDRRVDELRVAVEIFLAQYSTLVSAAAFSLGDLFKAEEYPTVDEVRAKFRVEYVFLPVPTSGDFRVDVVQDVAQTLRTEYESYYNSKIKDAVQDARERLTECVKHMSQQLADADVPRETKKGPVHRRKFHDSMIGNANELCSVLTALNITNDPKLEQARQALERAINNRTADDLRESDELRRDTKARVDAILDMF